MIRIINFRDTYNFPKVLNFREVDGIFGKLTYYLT